MFHAYQFIYRCVSQFTSGNREEALNPAAFSLDAFARDEFSLSEEPESPLKGPTPESLSRYKKNKELLNSTQY